MRGAPAGAAIPSSNNYNYGRYGPGWGPGWGSALRLGRLLVRRARLKKAPVAGDCPAKSALVHRPVREPPPVSSSMR